MAIVMREAMDLEDFERMEKGLPPRKKPKLKIPEHEKPVVTNEIFFKDLPSGVGVTNLDAFRKNHCNKDGAMFCGYEVKVWFEGGEEREGWMAEAEFLKLRALIPRDRIDLFKRIR